MPVQMSAKAFQQLRALARTAITDLTAGREALGSATTCAPPRCSRPHGTDSTDRPCTPVREQQITATKLLRELVEHVTGALEEPGDTDVLVWLKSCR